MPWVGVLRVRVGPVPTALSVGYACRGRTGGDLSVRGSPAASAQRIRIFDAVGIVASDESGVDGGGDRADAPGRVADVGEGAAGQVVLGAVDGVGAQAHVVRVDATREVALMAQHRVIGTGPSQSRDHSVLELVGEQMRGHGATSRRTGQARGPERPVAS